MQELQVKVERPKADTRRIEKEIADAQRIEDAHLPSTQSKRMHHYIRYFELLREERQALERLYEPIRTYALADDRSGLEFEVTTIVDIATWAERGENMLDLRRSGALSRHGALAGIASERLEEGWRNCDADVISDGVRDLISTVTEDGLGSKLWAGFAPRDVADWIFSVDHIELQYNLKYDGVPLRFLSPGTRGILLLILYLSLDKNDERPLIIDQPEENLDNASVYSVLVDYFREAKRRRQIVVISHNPNLVVNTDSEQIVVAIADRRENDLPTISYSTGPIEVHEAPEQSVRSMICQILEGGETAFLRREERYDLPRKGVRSWRSGQSLVELLPSTDRGTNIESW